MDQKALDWVTKRRGERGRCYLHLLYVKIWREKGGKKKGKGKKDKGKEKQKSKGERERMP